MTALRLAALAAATALLALPAQAQDAASGQGAQEGTPIEDQATTAEEGPVGDAATTDNLSLGTPADGDAATGAPEVGQTYVAETFTDWQLRCVRAPEGEDPCQLYQLLLDSDDNAVAEISLFGLEGGGQAVAGATVITPLETLLTEELTISVDGSRAKRYPFTWCSAIGCFARIGFTAEEIAQFRRGRVAQLTIVPVAAPDQQVVLDMSLAGFTAGFAAVDPN